MLIRTENCCKSIAKRYGLVDLKIFLCGLLLNGPNVPAMVSRLDKPNTEIFGHLAENVTRLVNEIPTSPLKINRSGGIAGQTSEEIAWSGSNHRPQASWGVEGFKAFWTCWKSSTTLQCSSLSVISGRDCSANCPNSRPFGVCFYDVQSIEL